MSDQTQERAEAPRLGYVHVHKDNVRMGSAVVKDPPFPSLDFVYRRDYDDLAERHAALLAEKERRDKELDVWTDVLETCLPTNEGYDDDTEQVLGNVIRSMRVALAGAACSHRGADAVSVQPKWVGISPQPPRFSEKERLEKERLEKVARAATALSKAHYGRARHAQFWTLNEREALAILRDALAALASGDAATEEQT